jgi:hypothetical protein
MVTILIQLNGLEVETLPQTHAGRASSCCEETLISSRGTLVPAFVVTA